MKKPTHVYLLNRLDISFIGDSCFVTFTDNNGKTNIGEGSLHKFSSVAERAVVHNIAMRISTATLKQDENESKHTETR